MLTPSPRGVGCVVGLKTAVRRTVALKRNAAEVSAAAVAVTFSSLDLSKRRKGKGEGEKGKERQRGGERTH